MTYRWFVVSCLGLSALLATGCGAIFNGSTTTIPVTAQPREAKIYLDGAYVGAAPAQLTVTSKESHRVDIQAPGYAAQTVHIEPQVNAGYVVLDAALFLLAIIPGVIAVAVDAGTGDWNDARPWSVGVSLDPAGSAPPVAALDAVITSPPPSAAGAEPPIGCQFDNQCKGDRLCVQGHCEEGPPPPPPPPPQPATAPTPPSVAH